MLNIVLQLGVGKKKKKKELLTFFNVDLSKRPFLLSKNKKCTFVKYFLKFYAQHF